MNVESIIFDVDGTLWDSCALLAQAYNIQMEQEGISQPYITPQVLKPHLGKTVTALADALFDGYIPAPERYGLMDRCVAQMDISLQTKSGPHMAYPEIRSTMEHLKKFHRLFIVSNGQKGYPQLVAEKLGITDLIDGYLSFGDTGKSKGQTLMWLMKTHDISSAVYVGDTQGDLEACWEAQIPLIYASYGFGKPEDCWKKIDTFAQLKEL